MRSVPCKKTSHVMEFFLHSRQRSISTYHANVPALSYIFGAPPFTYCSIPTTIHLNLPSHTQSHSLSSYKSQSLRYIMMSSTMNLKRKAQETPTPTSFLQLKGHQWRIPRQEKGETAALYRKRFFSSLFQFMGLSPTLPLGRLISYVYSHRVWKEARYHSSFYACRLLSDW